MSLPKTQTQQPKKKPLLLAAAPLNTLEGLLKDHGFDVTEDVNTKERISGVVFGGGGDICPTLYGEYPHPTTNYRIERDIGEINVFRRIMRTNTIKGGKNIPLIGICRGAQLLNCLNGGALWQDVDGHRSSHEMHIVDQKEPIKVTSTHHQMMRPSHLGSVIGFARMSETKATGDPNVFTKYPDEKDRIDPEVVFYKHSNTLCYQPHPEYSRTDPTLKGNTAFFFTCLHKLFKLQGGHDTNGVEKTT